MKTRNATRCNNRHDLLQLRPIYNGDLYITQSNIYDGAFIAKIVNRSVYSQKSSIVDTRLGSKYASTF